MQTERNAMESNAIQAPVSYDANALVTIKRIDGDQVSFPVLKVNQIEYDLAQVRYTEKKLMDVSALIKSIESNLTIDGWYNSSVDKEDVLRDLCSILNIEPKQTLRITATVSVEVEYDCPIDEVEDFDPHYFLQDNLMIDSYNSDLTIDSFNVEDTDVNW